MTRSRQVIFAIAPVSALALACTEHGPAAPTVPPTGEFTAAISCQASVGTPALSCGSAVAGATHGIDASVILGGQGTYVLLASSGTAYNTTTQVFSSNVTVKNLITQPMATTDGSTADTGGVKVFFLGPPTVTSGSGTITPNNNDGTGTFTAANQPYFKYSGVLASGATSPAKSWQLNVPSTVNTFTFQVFVTATLPADSAVLRWLVVSSGTTRNLRAVEIVRGTNTAWAVGDSGTILFFNGTSWTAPATGLALSKINLYGVQRDDKGMFAAGDSGKIVHLSADGLTWSLRPSGVTTTLFSVSKTVPGSASDTNTVLACGVGGVILYSADDGGTWAAQTSGTADTLFACGGEVYPRVFAAGQLGTVLRHDALGWHIVVSGVVSDLYTGGAGDSTDLTLKVWGAGAGGTIIHSGDGGMTFTTVPSPTPQDLFGINGTSTTSLYLVGAAGTIIHWNGRTWSAMASGTGVALHGVTVVSNAGFDQVLAVGNGGLVLNGTR